MAKGNPARPKRAAPRKKAPEPPKVFLTRGQADILPDEEKDKLLAEMHAARETIDIHHTPEDIPPPREAPVVVDSQGWTLPEGPEPTERMIFLSNWFEAALKDNRLPQPPFDFKFNHMGQCFMRISGSGELFYGMLKKSLDAGRNEARYRTGALRDDLECLYRIVEGEQAPLPPE